MTALSAKYVDSKIDFKGTNVVIVLLPPGSKGGTCSSRGLHLNNFNPEE